MTTENTEAMATTEEQSSHVGLVNGLAEHYGMNPRIFYDTVIATVMPKGAKAEQVNVFLAVANEYKLNPFTKEIFAFAGKGGGVQPIVSVDGWIKIINSHPQYDGMQFVDNFEDGNLVSVTCRMHRKDTAHPIEVTEYMAECRMDKDTWKKWPARMLRHKATIQCARYAFGFSGIIDPDEADRYEDSGLIDVGPTTYEENLKNFTASESEKSEEPSEDSEPTEPPTITDDDIPE